MRNSSSIGQDVPEKTMFSYIDGTPISDIGWKVKGQPLELIYSHRLIRVNISSENNDFGFNSIQKINF